MSKIGDGDLIIHFLTSSGVNEVSQQAKEWAQQSARVKQAVRNKQMIERRKRMDERVAQYLHLNFLSFWPTVRY